ncbi:hypothetical protein AUEXF2481DRAFT_36120 [Aureobasidium subglaciale EXF-2481]|uniref:BTB domain-containing protein n=1 Tax=Aureobasidium subglaciale (strain EXF-2481) TaxID=1043005 RepID=A0A074YXA1_AURSE|nr:uncharacterized protein AUEXF2481DRAFT_36120 [Aureobasidium subglaciale EXF-2481]KAI5203800.1 hypothetical protein E4T38_04952 [Aureobasidium subglaciale]KAI5222227.1 hypothetical protein E4T40_04990 [Aureobasidium subglaciale]KAI5226357.1 hypothetical protein E4T41_04809 [Aureobasidium subglaciale]KAI5262084.1 hypothetical protein E4T46_04702 [Aureobasidium subglaciale]KEQ98802.1 hypothetical protein AUEXF2481DRAFT_36120 [Aureobasidium subglaciale EXF-2481]
MAPIRRSQTDKKSSPRRSERVAAASQLDTSRVSIFVGSEQQKFVLNNEHAFECLFFEKALRAPWTESQTCTIFIEDVSICLFEIFKNCVTEKRLFSKNKNLKADLIREFGDQSCSESETHSEGLKLKSPQTWPFHILIKIYILADYLNTAIVRRAILDAMILKHENSVHVIGIPQIKLAYDYTYEGSPLRKLLVHVYAYDTVIFPDPRRYRDLPVEFLAAVMVTMGTKKPDRLCNDCYRRSLLLSVLGDRPDNLHDSVDGPPWEEMDSCVYHEHPVEEGGKTCKAKVARDKVLKRRIKETGSKIRYPN